MKAIEKLIFGRGREEEEQDIFYLDTAYRLLPPRPRPLTYRSLPATASHRAPIIHFFLGHLCCRHRSLRFCTMADDLSTSEDSAPDPHDDDELDSTSAEFSALSDDERGEEGAAEQEKEGAPAEATVPGVRALDTKNVAASTKSAASKRWGLLKNVNAASTAVMMKPAVQTCQLTPSRAHGDAVEGAATPVPSETKDEIPATEIESSAAPIENKRLPSLQSMLTVEAMRSQPPQPGKGQTPHTEWFTGVMREKGTIQENVVVEYFVKDALFNEDGNVSAWTVAAAKVNKRKHEKLAALDTTLSGNIGDPADHIAFNPDDDIELDDVIGGAKKAGEAVLDGAASIFAGLAGLVHKLKGSDAKEKAGEMFGSTDTRVAAGNAEDASEGHVNLDKFDPYYTGKRSKRSGKELWKLAKKHIMGSKRYHMIIKDTTADDMCIRVAREAWFYNHFPQEDFSRPTLYYASSDFETPERMIVIMENLGPRAKQLDHVHDGKLQGPLLNPESIKVRV